MVRWTEESRRFPAPLPRYGGLFPAAWTPEGKGLGWPDNGDPSPGNISAAGVQCACAQAQLATLAGEATYRDAAAKAMDAYWREFGQTRASPPWGATLDAGAEDKGLGPVAGDERHKQVGRVLFQAASQTISRPGAMFGPGPGIQGEHYNRSNCTSLRCSCAAHSLVPGCWPPSHRPGK